MRKILIVGATSAIAQALARTYAEDGDRLFLTARGAERLAAMAADLRVRGADRIETLQLDSNDLDRHQDLIIRADAALGGLDVALIAHGTLPDQAACEAAFTTAREALETNFLSVVSLLTHLANAFEAKGDGVIAVISSVAGDRGRQSNYLYGAAKGGVSLFAQGLRNRLYKSGIAVVTIKPGFVDTPMTAGLAKGGPLWSTPERIADGIYRAIDRRTPEVYLPWFWRWVMLVVRLIPERIFRHLRL